MSSSDNEHPNLGKTFAPLPFIEAAHPIPITLRIEMALPSLKKSETDKF
jgi:hypothetical protein